MLNVAPRLGTEVNHRKRKSMYKRYKDNLENRRSAAKMASRQSSKTVPASKPPPDNVHPEPIPKPKTPVTRHATGAPKDLMISYSHADKEIMMMVREKLEANGISVWVDVSGLQAGVDFLSKIGQAIIDAKLFISLLSSNSVKSKFCQDELALAYVSGTAIFPVALEDKKSLYPIMDTGMKLQVARYKWVDFTDKTKYEEKFKELIAMLKAELEQDSEDDKPDQKKGKRAPLQRSQSRANMRQNQVNEEEYDILDDMFYMQAEEYWGKTFGKEEKVEWKKFVAAFTKDYDKHLKGSFSSSDQRWLMSILHREFEVDDKEFLHKQLFFDFCTIDGEAQSVWMRVRDQALESYAMKNVFDMESSVRVEAIENLGKFRSKAVVEALQDLLTDDDANVRAVAAVSLARTEANDGSTAHKLMRVLRDKDRLVREAGCLALGHLKIKESVSPLLHMWRNDVISHVREAAAVALQQIGGEEVENAMHVTKVLAEEIRQLTQS